MKASSISSLLAARGSPGPHPCWSKEAFHDPGAGSLSSKETPETLPFNWALLEDTGSGICLPLRTTGKKLMGVLLAGWEQDEDSSILPSERVAGPRLGTLTEIAANALQKVQLHQELEGAYLQSVLALARALEARDTSREDHSQRQANLAESIASALNCSADELMAIRWAALLHDIGKIRVPDEILNKPGPLTDAEWSVMKRHPEIGAEIVAPVKKLEAVAPIIRSHREKFDGTGYPYGLAGQDIPLGARILMIANAYTAMTSELVYRKARTHTEAISELKRYSGTQFDPEIVEVFLQVIETGRHPA